MGGQQTMQPNARDRKSSTGRFHRGFTIIELMLVVTIISILLLVAIPTFQSYSARSKIAEGLLLADPVLQSVAEYYHGHGAWPADNATAGIDPPASFATRYVRSIAVTDGPPASIILTFDETRLSGVGAATNTIVFTPRTDTSLTVQWSCSGGTLPHWARPPRCRI